MNDEQTLALCAWMEEHPYVVIAVNIAAFIFSILTM